MVSCVLFCSPIILVSFGSVGVIPPPLASEAHIVELKSHRKQKALWSSFAVVLLHLQHQLKSHREISKQNTQLGVSYEFTGRFQNHMRVAW